MLPTVTVSQPIVGRLVQLRKLYLRYGLKSTCPLPDRRGFISKLATCTSDYVLPKVLKTKEKWGVVRSTVETGVV